jgi:hypothetical protein
MLFCEKSTAKTLDGIFSFVEFLDFLYEININGQASGLTF